MYHFCCCSLVLSFNFARPLNRRRRWPLFPAAVPTVTAQPAPPTPSATLRPPTPTARHEYDALEASSPVPFGRQDGRVHVERDGRAARHATPADHGQTPRGRITTSGEQCGQRRSSGEESGLQCAATGQRSQVDTHHRVVAMSQQGKGVGWAASCAPLEGRLAVSH